MEQEDIEIISRLRKNSRKSFTDLSRETGIPITTLCNKISRYEKNKFIRKYACLIDPKMLGYPIQSSIALKIDRAQKERFLEHVLANHNVNSVYKIDSGFDFMIETIFKDIKELHDFLEDITAKFSVKEKFVFHIIEGIKEETFLEK